MTTQLFNRANLDEILSKYDENEKMLARTLLSSEELKFLLAEKLQPSLYKQIILCASLLYENVLQKIQSIIKDDLHESEISHNFKKIAEMVDEIISTMKKCREMDKNEENSTRH